MHAVPRTTLMLQVTPTVSAARPKLNNVQRPKLRHQRLGSRNVTRDTTTKGKHERQRRLASEN